MYGLWWEGASWKDLVSHRIHCHGQQKNDSLFFHSYWKPAPVLSALLCFVTAINGNLTSLTSGCSSREINYSYLRSWRSRPIKKSVTCFPLFLCITHIMIWHYSIFLLLLVGMVWGGGGTWGQNKRRGRLVTGWKYCILTSSALKMHCTHHKNLTLKSQLTNIPKDTTWHNTENMCLFSIVNPLKQVIIHIFDLIALMTSLYTWSLPFREQVTVY